MAKFTARRACGFSFPRITMSAQDFDGSAMSLVGSQAAVEFRAYAGAVDIPLSINSTESLDSPAIFDWDDSSKTLDIHLSPAQVDSLSAGQWIGVVKILGPTGGDIWHDVEGMTFTFEVLGT